MGRIYESIDAQLADWIQHQPVFFVATAPSEGGHINCSPKGLNTLRILDPHQVCYLDLTGSGIETVAHLRDNGRIVLMFCAFEGPPRILRLHGSGKVVQAGDGRFDELLQYFLPLDSFMLSSARALVEVSVERIADSCGYGVPLMRYEGERAQLAAWTDNRLRKVGPEAILQYRSENNFMSIDGLPGLDADVGRPSTVRKTSEPHGDGG